MYFVLQPHQSTKRVNDGSIATAGRKTDACGAGLYPKLVLAAILSASLAAGRFAVGKVGAVYIRHQPPTSILLQRKC
jgi:hypothetical protein